MTKETYFKELNKPEMAPLRAALRLAMLEACERAKDSEDEDKEENNEIQRSN